MHIIYTEFDDYNNVYTYFPLVNGELKRSVTIDEGFSILIEDIVNECKKGELNLNLIKQDSDSNDDPFNCVLNSLKNKGVNTSNREKIVFPDDMDQFLSNFDDSKGLGLARRIWKSIENNNRSVERVICQSETAPSEPVNPKTAITGGSEKKPKDLPEDTSMLYRIIARKYGVDK